ncbi:hypothetical protein HMPREF3212_01504 [Citrobacter freundii]|nr:hypothetical protein HMPREF3212_01504 [Citrobacter freundii]
MLAKIQSFCDADLISLAGRYNLLSNIPHIFKYFNNNEIPGV